MSEDTFLDRFELNDETAQAILKSANIQGALISLGTGIAARATTGDAKFNVKVVHWPARNAVQVSTGNVEAMRAEATDRALTRAIFGG